MYTIYDLIFACIMGGFGGILVGLATMAVCSKDDYEIGYEKGKEKGREEEKERIRSEIKNSFKWSGSDKG